MKIYYTAHHVEMTKILDFHLKQIGHMKVKEIILVFQYLV